MAKGAGVTKYKAHGKISRPGVHSKCKHSIHKTSKHYVKGYVGQGK
jgi:hypothetical protein